jgi:hypothetical protein
LFAAAIGSIVRFLIECRTGLHQPGLVPAEQRQDAKVVQLAGIERPQFTNGRQEVVDTGTMAERLYRARPGMGWLGILCFLHALMFLCLGERDGLITHARGPAPGW